eukprot:CAMPEP_0204913460 /NCGR_PEP_ID=MMETSP1397-20131031/11319_1 /ASSEMBLY_ACC=CAM_ASM_000891 /TAXON_ID=49980 /ORGANISM="Climacostomum Climacostomum virens, Strain Stock W-24" /LENGTH=376 /DNA_ID=CAMNT_0052084695 /DNA_START=680 /DNA_END=1810 /DNA_ORIENTATION=-
MSIDASKAEPNIVVTAGADTQDSCYIRVWNLAGGNVVHLEDLAGTHERAVNVVRFSPDGKLLASGGDDAVVVLWEKKLKPVFGEEEEVLGWTASKVLRGHTGEVHDLCWKEDSTALVSASVDGSAIVFDTVKGKLIQRLECQGRVMGVAWSPHSIATQSSDRTVRIWKLGGSRYFIAHSLREHLGQRLYQPDIHAHAFFRRLSFSPDGSILVTPAGQWNEAPLVHCYVHKVWDTPSFSLPIPDSTAVACRFCPVAFEATDNSSLLNGLGQKWVWAVATRTAVLIYDSEHIQPLHAVSNAHYSSLTDLVWCSPNLLAVSSNDGFVSLISFEDNELGKPIETKLEPTEVILQEKTMIEVKEQKTAEGKRRFTPMLITP